MKKISLTGAGGHMGKAVVERLMREKDLSIRALFRHDAKEERLARRWQKKYGNRLEVLFGDIRQEEDRLRLCQGADYLIHMAALVPPRDTADPAVTLAVNRDGSLGLVEAVIRQGNHTKFIFISSVAVYGHRDPSQPWGRVGDPLLPSMFDVYGMSKMMTEYGLMESELAHWLILRQTAMLYDNLLMENMHDGLMFHTPWNTPIEWVTERDTARLLAAIIRRDGAGRLPNFWQRIYNIGGGAATRETGYETFDQGFGIIGSSVKTFFEPYWNPTRNFHCIWFSDSDVLEERFHFRRESCEAFWQRYGKKHAIYKGGRLLPPKLLRKMTMEPLLKHPQAPAYWLAQGDEARIQAFYGGREAYEALPKTWDKTELFCHSKAYRQIKETEAPPRLDHGYDESKPEAGLDIADVRQAAAFRGGECLSESMSPGDLYGKLLWRCHAGHSFEARPFTILKGGHWCPVCCQSEKEWHWNRLARRSPFHAQVWWDHRGQEEDLVFTLQQGKASMMIDKETE